MRWVSTYRSLKAKVEDKLQPPGSHILTTFSLIITHLKLRARGVGLRQGDDVSDVQLGWITLGNPLVIDVRASLKKVLLQTKSL